MQMWAGIVSGVPKTKMGREGGSSRASTPDIYLVSVSEVSTYFKLLVLIDNDYGKIRIKALDRGIHSSQGFGLWHPQASVHC